MLIVRSILADKESVLSIASQAINLFIPIAIMLLINDKYGSHAVVKYEVVLSLIAFFSVFQDFSTSYLFTYRRFSKKICFKYFCTIVSFKLTASIICSILLCFLYVFLGGDPFNYFMAFAVLILSSFDVPLIFFSEGKSYLHSFLYALKSFSCFIFILIGLDVFLALFLSCLCFSILIFFNYYKKGESKFYISKRIFVFLFKKYKTVTLTETITAIFSQLDSYLVSAVANEKTVFIYVSIRKAIRASNVVMNYLFRISFTRYKSDNENWKIPIYLILIISTFIIICLNLFGESIFIMYADINYDSNILKLTIFTQSMILLVGSLKSIIRNIYFFANSKFKEHLLFTVISSAVFIIPLYVASSNSLALDAAELSFYRVMTDVIYLLLFLILLIVVFLRKKNNETIGGFKK